MTESTQREIVTPTLEQQATEALANGELQQAERLCRSLLSSGSGPLHHWRMLVNALRRLGRPQEALAVLDMLVQQSPGSLDVRFDRAEVLLQLGDFARGWPEYQYRYSLDYTSQLDRKVQKPLWDGRLMRGKTLLIHDEQGFGDTFQFLRLIQRAKAQSQARIVLQIRAEQAAFAQRMPGIDQVILQGELPPAFDMHCHLMTLPMALELQLADLPGTMPYLSSDPERVRTWQKRLAGLPRPLVGLVWAGRSTHFNDNNRSMSLDTLAPLARNDVTFVSIQKGDAAAQAKSPLAGMRIVNLGDEIADFDDTAAILTLLDLLISVDSAPVHLAGALGRPAWVMLPFVPDWRWLLERDDTPWYPSLRLFRQSAVGDWSHVVTGMTHALKQVIAQSR